MGKPKILSEYIFHYNSPLGIIKISSSGPDITGLRFDCQSWPSDIQYTYDDSLPIFHKVSEWLDIYFDGGVPDIEIPLLPNVSQFTTSVLEVVSQIPYGNTMTYGEIGRILSSKTDTHRYIAPRAVGAAVGSNPISLLIPCHRVVGKNGTLTGYAGGIERKRFLLEIELENHIPNLFKSLR